MQIKKVTLTNIRCFDFAEFEFEQSTESGRCILIFGNQGMGKTTLLRSIAMGLCNKTSASALLRELYGDFVRYQSEDDKGRIRIEFVHDCTPGPVWTETTIQRTSFFDEEVEQKTYPENDFPWSDVFTCGYGAARGGYATQDIVDYSSVDSLYTLFNYDAPLQNPELVLRRIGDDDQVAEYLKIIDQVLMLSEGSTLLTKQGITVSDQWIENVPFGGWGDGHRATLAWASTIGSFFARICAAICSSTLLPET